MWSMKIVISAKPRQKSTALGARHRLQSSQSPAPMIAARRAACTAGVGALPRAMTEPRWRERTVVGGAAGKDAAANAALRHASTRKAALT